MRNILISIKPEWVCKILNREKTLEIRKSIPKELLKGEECLVEIYCTKDQNKILAGTPLVDGSWKCWNRKDWNKQQRKDCGFGKYNGKVVARWHLKRIDFLIDYGIGVHYADKDYNLLDLDYLRTNACLTDEKIYLYLGLKKDSGYYNDGYAWHIDNLEIYDTPKELSEFFAFIPNNECREDCLKCDCYDKEHETCLACYNLKKRLKRPPQSWCYIE